MNESVSEFIFKPHRVDPEDRGIMFMPFPGGRVVTHSVPRRRDTTSLSRDLWRQVGKAFDKHFDGRNVGKKDMKAYVYGL